MATQLVPSLGSSGTFVVKPPFDQLIDAKTKYTCVDTAMIAKLVADNDDPFSLYYAPQNIDQATYSADVNAGVVLVSLQSSDGKVAVVPSSYISSYANPNGIPYVVWMLTANLGALRTDTDFTLLNQKVVNLIKDTIGVDTTIKLGQVSTISMMSQADSANVEAARQANISAGTTDTAKLIAAEQLNTLLQTKVADLESYIIASLSTSTSTSTSTSQSLSTSLSSGTNDSNSSTQSLSTSTSTGSSN